MNAPGPRATSRPGEVARRASLAPAISAAVSAAVCTVVAAGLLTAPAAHADPAAGARPAAADRAAYARTTPREARRVDGVRARIAWTGCPVGPDRARCGTIRLPLDYDDPGGARITVSLGLLPATDQRRKLGTLFVNPGGPGSTAADFAVTARGFLAPEVLARYDVVGVDPRGLGNGTQLRCFTSQRAKDAAVPVPDIAFPVSRAEESESLAASRRFARACGTTGEPRASAASTAAVARDMDVVRRALGDRRLDYLGFSYGTQLGQVYANLFPDRVGRMVLDGVLDPVAWTRGRGDSGRRVPSWDRIRVADGAAAAWQRFLELCDQAGPACAFAADAADPRSAAERFALLVDRLGQRPVTVEDPDAGPIQYGDRDLESYALTVLASMGDPEVGGLVGSFLDQLWQLSGQPAASRRDAGRRVDLARSAGILRERTAEAARGTGPAAGPRDEQPASYTNGDDVFITVACSDAVQPARQTAWRRAADAADRRVPYFGRQLVWNGSACAGREWQARDEDRYLGPFDRRTRSTILVVGNYWDPQTSYRHGAVPAARTLGNARLLRSDSWGHTAYGTSTCMDRATTAYLVRGRLPAPGTECVGPQPFGG